MATTENGIYYPNDYSEVADVPADMKLMAESVDREISEDRETIDNVNTRVSNAFSGIISLRTGKVDKVDGKGLSTNDYSNEEKAQLSTNTTDIETLTNEISGLQTKITEQNKLSSDLVDDTNKTHKFVTASEKTNWNAKYDKPNTGIPKTDLANNVQTSLDKADTAIQEHQDISGKEDKSNKTTELTSESTDTQYPSAKAVYDSQAEQDTEIEELQTKVTNLEETINSELEDGVATGTEITVNDSATADASLLPNGNTSQEENPSVENPKDIHALKGSNTIKVSNKNWFDNNKKADNQPANESKINTGIRMTHMGGASPSTGAIYSKWAVIDLKNFVGKTVRAKSRFIASANNKGRYALGLSESDSSDNELQVFSNTSDTEISFVVPEFTSSKTYLCLLLYANYGGTSYKGDYVDFTNLIITIDDTDLSYIDHKEQVKTLTLPQGMEMCNIENYRDEFVKDLSTGKWYKDEKINKAILIDTENWADRPNFNACDRFVLSTNIIPIQTQKCYSNYFITVNSDVSNTDIGKIILNNGTQIIVNFSEKGTTTLGQFKDWLSSHNVELYYVRANPQLIEITDTTLIAELDELLEIRTYYGQTNITVEAEDLAPMMTLNYKKSNRVLRNEIDTIKARLDLLEG